MVTHLKELMIFGHSLSGDAFLMYSFYILKFTGLLPWNKRITFGKAPWALEKNIYLPSVHTVLPKPKKKKKSDLLIMLFRSFSGVENERTLAKSACVQVG